ncbi:MAG: 50S ribosomal protein L30 [Oligoflexia bacterium]|nr:50S ribosomal protein L30 [Oligoflexia bacterium]
MAKTFKVKLIRSIIGSTPSQRATVKGLGLRKRNSESVVKDNPATRGMIFHVQHLLEVQKGS